MAFLRRLFILVIASLAPLTAVLAAEPQRIILAFGDSLTAGYRLKPDQSFPAQLEASLRSEGRNVRVINAGVSGETTFGGRARLPRMLAELKTAPDVAILELGANDMLTLRDPAETRANLDAMLAEFRARGVPVILCGMFSAPQLGLRWLDGFNDLYPELARKYGATLYPFFLKGVAFNEDLLLDDGLHPNPRGIALVTQNILPTVRKMLDGLPPPKLVPAVTLPAGATTDAPPVRRP